MLPEIDLMTGIVIVVVIGGPQRRKADQDPERFAGRNLLKPAVLSGPRRDDFHNILAIL